MARTFAAASAQALNATTSPIVTYPGTIAIWCRPTGAGSSQALFSLKDSGAADDRDEVALSRDMGAAGKFLLYLVDWYGVGAYAQVAVPYVLGQWHHVCAVLPSTASRSIFMDGGNKATNTTTVSGPGYDRIGVGHIPQTTHFYANADLAEAAIWNIALTDADVAQLGLGLSPLLVHPEALVFYAPLLGTTSPEIEIMGRRELALVNAPAVAPHPRILQPAGPLRLSRRAVAYAITGIARTASGAALAGATISLFRTSDHAYIGQTTSAGDGRYTFTVPDATTQYFAVAYKAGSPDVMGTTVNTLHGTT